MVHPVSMQHLLTNSSAAEKVQQSNYTHTDGQQKHLANKIKKEKRLQQQKTHETEKSDQTKIKKDEAKPVITPTDIVKARQVLSEVYIDEKIEKYIVDIVFATREPSNYGLEELKDLITFGASPRASIYLTQAAKAHAFLRRRGYVTPEDVRSIGMDVMRHRVILSYEAEAEEMTTEEETTDENPWIYIIILIIVIVLIILGILFKKGILHI